LTGYVDLRVAAADLNKQYRSATLFNPTLFQRLVIAARALTKALEILAPGLDRARRCRIARRREDAEVRAAEVGEGRMKKPADVADYG
jgi:hypothetical protein